MAVPPAEGDVKMVSSLVLKPFMPNALTVIKVKYGTEKGRIDEASDSSIAFATLHLKWPTTFSDK